MLCLIFIAILGVVIPNAVLVCVVVFISILSAIMLNVVNLSVVAPLMSMQQNFCCDKYMLGRPGDWILLYIYNLV